MKMVKKILLGLAAGAVVLGFVGCGRDAAGNEDLIKISGSSGSIDYTNDSDDVTRGFKTLSTKHLDAICEIEYTVTDLVKGKGAVATGTMGYIFNVVKDDDDKYSFSIAGVRYNQDTGNIEAYVESFKDIAKDKLEKELENGKKADSSPSYANGFGFKLVDKTAVNALLAAQNTTPKKMKLWIDVVANGQEKKTKADGTTEWVTPKGRNGTPGTYTVTFYGSDPGRNSASLSYDVTWNDTSEKLCSVTVLSENVNAAYDSTKGLTSMQSDVGFYANVYKGQTLTGTWKFSQIKKEAEEIVE